MFFVGSCEVVEGGWIEVLITNMLFYTYRQPTV
jgi:hypothetical protein